MIEDMVEKVIRKCFDDSFRMKKKMQVFMMSYHQDGGTVGIADIKGYLPEGERNIEFFGSTYRIAGRIEAAEPHDFDVYTHDNKIFREEIPSLDFTFHTELPVKTEGLNTGVRSLRFELGNIPYIVFRNGLTYTKEGLLPRWIEEDLEGEIRQDLSISMKHDRKRLIGFYSQINRHYSRIR